MKKEEIMMGQIQEEFEDWKEKYDNILQVKNLSNRNKKQEREELIKETQLIKGEDGELLISGGGRVLLFLFKSFGRSWKEYLDELKNKRRKGCYLEAMQFKHREDLFRIKLIDKVDEMDVKRLLE